MSKASKPILPAQADLDDDPAEPIGSAEFASRMDRLGPFEPRPHMGVAVSGGADSLAAAVLTRDWAARRDGDVVAFVVDHGLRAASCAEMRETCERLKTAGVAALPIGLRGLAPGPGLAARARTARHAALEAACAARGIVHLVFGHHAADQAETVVIRLLARSAAPGLSAMAAVVETPVLRRLRPLLDIPPARLRATLGARGLSWVDDPSNKDTAQQRARIRALRSDAEGTGAATHALVEASFARGRARAADEAAWADELGQRATVFPLGFAVLRPGPIAAGGLASLLATIGGAPRPPSLSQVETLAADLHSATLAGVRILPAGRLGPGWLLVREPDALAAPVAARQGTVWDGRFRLTVDPGEGVALGAWGAETPRDRAGWPSLVRRGLPVLRKAGAVVADPSSLLAGPAPRVLFAPARAAAGAPFFPLPLPDC